MFYSHLCVPYSSDAGPHTLYLFNKLYFLSFQVAPGELWFCTSPAWKGLYVLHADCKKTRTLSLSLSRVQLFCDPLDWSPPGSSVHGASQTRILEWAAMSSSRSTGLSVLCAMWPSGAPAWYHSAQADYQYFLIKPLIQSFSIKEVQMHSHSEKQNCIRVTRNMCLHGDVAPSKGWKR